MVANLARDFPNDVDKRLDAYLIQKVGNYLSNHAVSVKLFDPKSFSGDSNEETNQQRSVEGKFPQTNNTNLIQILSMKTLPQNFQVFNCLLLNFLFNKFFPLSFEKQTVKVEFIFLNENFC